MTVADQQHWLSRVQAGPEDSTIGFYLTGKVGRLLAAENLANWITNSEEKGLAVVTGSPGSGKSTLLALPVLLTQPPKRGDLLRYTPSGSLIQRAADLLPAETPVIAIHARGLNTDQVSSEIARALGRRANSASGLLEGLDTTPQLHTRVVIVDAVDEAASPTTLLGSLLVPLAHHPGIKVVLGSRRHVLSAVGQVDLTIDLDTVSYRDPQALADYAHQLLIAAHEPSINTPYQSEDSVVRSDSFHIGKVVAEAIAKRATGRATGPESFLSRGFWRYPFVTAPNLLISRAWTGKPNCHPVWPMPSMKIWPVLATTHHWPGFSWRHWPGQKVPDYHGRTFGLPSPAL